MTEFVPQHLPPGLDAFTEGSWAWRRLLGRPEAMPARQALFFAFALFCAGRALHQTILAARRDASPIAYLTYWLAASGVLFLALVQHQ